MYFLSCVEIKTITIIIIIIIIMFLVTYIASHRCPWADIIWLRDKTKGR